MDADVSARPGAFRSQIAILRQPSMANEIAVARPIPEIHVRTVILHTRKGCISRGSNTGSSSRDQRHSWEKCHF